jgi:glutamyl-tRNA reductase
MTADRLVAFLWHQRSASLDTRERLQATLTQASDRVILDTCHRVELYAAVPREVDAASWLVSSAHLSELDSASLSIAEGAAAAAQLFRVAAGLDSAVAGEQQILRQVRRAYAGAPSPHPLLARLFERALHVGRAVRREHGFTSERSVGSLAVDEVLRELADPSRATVLVIGAGEMGRLAVRALGHRVGRVVVANRDLARAAAVADAEGAEALGLSDVPRALAAADAVISAADTRGKVLTHAVLGARLHSRGRLVLVDIAVPRSVGEDARKAEGLLYRTVDDLPGAAANESPESLAAGIARCVLEAERFFRESSSERVEAIVSLRVQAERVRREKLERALRRLGHLTARDRRIVEALSTRLTDALLHEPTVALREDRARPDDARALFAARPEDRS